MAKHVRRDADGYKLGNGHQFKGRVPADLDPGDTFELEREGKVQLAKVVKHDQVGKLRLTHIESADADEQEGGKKPK